MSSLWMRERFELMRAMRSAPSHIQNPRACDYAPALELVGIYTAHATVTRMVMRGQLSAEAGALLNGALGCNSFCVLHHCTHESLSQHNEEHAPFENMVFRLACLLLFFDDGYKEAHRAHHQRTNGPGDPDLYLSHSTLPELGALIAGMSTQRTFIHVGTPVGLPAVQVLHKLGVLRRAIGSWVLQKAVVNWDNMTLKMAAFETLRVLEDDRAEHQPLLRTLRATWRGASGVSSLILSLFFARFPHRHGVPDGKQGNAPDTAGSGSAPPSFHDGTYRGQGQVDLWMMGEGAHHMHHAKSDVSYTRLPAVCAEVEVVRPDLKTTSRGNANLSALEYGNSPHRPPFTEASAPPSMRIAVDRAQACLGVLPTDGDEDGTVDALLCTDPAAGVATIATAVVGAALHTTTTADLGLLRRLSVDMKLQGNQHPQHPLPCSEWHRTVFAESTAEELRAAGGRIQAEVAAVARSVGATAVQPGDIRKGADFQESYLDFFIALADALVGTEQQQSFLRRLSSRSNWGAQLQQ